MRLSGGLVVFQFNHYFNKRKTLGINYMCKNYSEIPKLPHLAEYYCTWIVNLLSYFPDRRRPRATSLQVVAEGIPCVFTLGAGVSTFDLVLMAEHAAPSEGISVPAAEAAVSVASADALAGAVAAEAGAGTDGEGDNKDDQPATTTSAAEQADAQTVAAVETQEGPEGDEVVVGASADDAGVAVETGEEFAAPSSVVVEGKGAAESETPAAPAVSATVDGEQDGDEVAPPEVPEDSVVDTAVDLAATSVAAVTDAAADAMEAAGAEAADFFAAAVAAAGLGAEPEAGAVAAETGAASAGSAAESSPLGCSTITTEIVVLSSELDFELEGGQWRYLEADAAPGEGEDTSPVEVSKGVRFSATLVAQDGGDAEV